MAFRSLAIWGYSRLEKPRTLCADFGAPQSVQLKAKETDFPGEPCEVIHGHEHERWHWDTSCVVGVRYVSVPKVRKRRSGSVLVY